MHLIPRILTFQICLFTIHWAVKFHFPTAGALKHSRQHEIYAKRTISNSNIFCFYSHPCKLAIYSEADLGLLQHSRWTLSNNNEQLEAINDYHKTLHLGCCSSPKSTSDIPMKHCLSFFFLAYQNAQLYNHHTPLTVTAQIISYKQPTVN